MRDARTQITSGAVGDRVDAPAFEARLADLLGSDGDRIFALMSVLEENLPTTEQRHLWFLGVDPRAQGQGLGSALLPSTLTRCDATGSPRTSKPRASTTAASTHGMGSRSSASSPPTAHRRSG
jgi:GNAT superfamily N-acetyltransferase